METLTYPHITLAVDGRAWITGCNTKVIEVALDHMAHGWTAEEIHFQHPHLPLSHIHSALAYYYDHRSELDEAMSVQVESVASFRAASSPSMLAERARPRKLVTA
jgi:uncharacterized protein (DUF433 family)